MTETSISLFSILCGILGANGLGYFFDKYSFGLLGNSIAGVFGSVFFIKSLGRLGVDPMSIMESGELNIILFAGNIALSILGGVVAVMVAHKVEDKMNG